jgi:hypothetical protein
VPGAPSGRPIAGLDRAEANDFGKLADRLEQRPPAGAQITAQVGRAWSAV